MTLPLGSDNCKTVPKKCDSLCMKCDNGKWRYNCNDCNAKLCKNCMSTELCLDCLKNHGSRVIENNNYTTIDLEDAKLLLYIFTSGKGE